MLAKNLQTLYLTDLEIVINEILDCFFQSLYHSYGGHSSHVTNVSFLQDDSRLVSTGGGDTSVLQWIVN